MHKKINVAIIGGGISNEREISLKTSKQIALALPSQKYNTFFIEIAKDNRWLFKKDHFSIKNGVSQEKSKSIILKDKNDYVANQDRLKERIDVVFIALHGKNGEDGKIQAIFDLLKIPYTGSGVLASALGMDKAKCLEFVSKYGIHVPKSIILSKKSVIDAGGVNNLIKEKINYPCVVKPNESGSSIGISIVEKEKNLKPAIVKAFQEDERIIIEEYIKGRELTCGILGNTGKTELLSLPPVEIITHDAEFFDYNAKYFSKNTEEICPANISQTLIKEIQKQAKKIHEILGCDGLTRSDFILSKKDGQLYFLEINTIPGQTEASLCPKEAMVIGLTFEEFIEKQIKLALNKHKK